MRMGLQQTVLSRNYPSHKRISPRKIHTVVALCLIQALFLSFGLFFSYCTPLWNPPDEERHFAYCEYIAQNHRFPNLAFDDKKINITQAIHPPLYYLFASLFCETDGKLIQETVVVNDGPGFDTITHPKDESTFPYSGKAREAHLIRLLSLIISSVMLCFLYFLVLSIFPGETTLATATTLFVAMNPQFLHVSASVSNEPFSVALSTIYLFTLLGYLKHSDSLTHHIVTGGLLGCCLLSKLSTMFYLPLTAGVLMYVYHRDQRKLVQSFLLVMCAATLAAGWWYLRNWLVFDDPLLTKFLIDSQPWGLRHTPISMDYTLTILARTFVSFFGHFGARQISLSNIHIFMYATIVTFGIIGWFRPKKREAITSPQVQALGILFLSLSGCLTIFLWMNMTYIGVSMGRYLFIVIAPIAILLFAGLRFLLTPRWRPLFFMALSFLLVAMNLDIFFRILKPAYTETGLITGVKQPEFSYPTAEINASTTIAQSFICPRNNLSAIRVMFSNLNASNSGDVIFALKENQIKGKVLHRMNLPLEEIKDNMRYCFIFPPIKNSMNKEYLFSFSSSSQSDGTGISLWYETRDCYPGGSMVVNGKPVSGDLYYATYCFTGEHPKTDWQGAKEVVINQGLYVGIRELQLYNERSKEFREKTITHQKIMRFKKAHKNRKTMIHTNNHA